MDTLYRSLFTITQGFSANLYFLHTLVLYYGCNSRFHFYRLFVYVLWFILFWNQESCVGKAKTNTTVKMSLGDDYFSVLFTWSGVRVIVHVSRRECVSAHDQSCGPSGRLTLTTYRTGTSLTFSLCTVVHYANHGRCTVVEVSMSRHKNDRDRWRAPACSKCLSRLDKTRTGSSAWSSAASVW